MITVAAVRVGAKYSLEHVEKLFRAVRRNLTLDHDYVLLTDRPDEVPVVEGTLAVMPTAEPKWWGKLELFRRDWPGTNDLLFVDLDNVICGSLDDLATWPGAIVGIRDVVLKGQMNSGCMKIRPRAAPEVWEHYAEDKGAARFRYRWGDQHLISEVAKGKIAYWPEEWVPFYKYSTVEQRDTARVVSYNGHPKPWHLPDDPTVSRHWI